VCEEGTMGAYHAELDIRLAVSTVPPRTTSFMPSIIPEPPPPPTRGCMRDLSASMVVVLMIAKGVDGGRGQGEWRQCCGRVYDDYL
jgi:hypothetical protein